MIQARIASRPSGNGPGLSLGIAPLGLIQLSGEFLGSAISDSLGTAVLISRASGDVMPA